MNEEKKREITELAKAILGTFTVQYALAYKTALVEKVIEDKQAGEPEKWELLSRPPNKDPIRTGYLTKMGDVRKNWKKRFFVVRHDYVVEYFENEEVFKKGGKPKGQMRLAGFNVQTDPNAFAVEKLRELFKALHIDEVVPESKEYKPFTIEMYHSSRRCWFIQCVDEAEYTSWTETFKTVCYRANGSSNDDPVAAHAFNHAVRETRWALGRWGWWSYGGTEEDILTDLVAEHISWAILGDLYNTLDGAPRIKRMVRDGIESTVQGIVRALVSPAWKAAAAAMVSARPALEDGVKAAIDPVIQAQQDLVQTLKDKTVAIVNPASQEHVVPYLGQILEVVAAPLTAGFTEMIQVWTKRITEFEAVATAAGTGDLDSVGRDLKSFGGRFWEFHTAYYKMREFAEPLGLLGAVVANVYSWSIIWNIEAQMEQLIDNAMYTFVHDLKEKTADGSAVADGIAAAAAIGAVKADTIARFKADALHLLANIFKELFLQILLPALQSVVLTPVKELLAPLEDAIPGPVKDFVSVTKCFEDLLVGIVTDLVDGAVTPAVSRITF